METSKMFKKHLKEQKRGKIVTLILEISINGSSPSYLLILSNRVQNIIYHNFVILCKRNNRSKELNMVYRGRGYLRLLRPRFLQLTLLWVTKYKLCPIWKRNHWRFSDSLILSVNVHVQKSKACTEKP